MTNPIIETVNSISDSIEDFKKANDERLAAQAKRQDELLDRVETIEANDSRPSRHGSGDSQFSAAQCEYKSVFLDWLRRPLDKSYERRISEAAHDLSKKDVSIGVGAEGGFALPEQISRKIEIRERQLNPFLNLVRNEKSSTNDFKSLVSLGDGTAGWSAETGTRSATLSPNLRERAPTMGEQYALPTASNWSLQDIFFDVEEWLVDDIAAEWSSQLATSIISGSGSAQPTGITNTAPVSTSDDSSPMRDAAAIQYVPVDSASPVSLHIDDLIDVVSSIKEKYLDQVSTAFVMHRLTAASLRKLKSSTGGDYLWQPSSQQGQPDRLLGYPVFTCDAVDQVSADAHCVFFGNWRRAYVLVTRTGMELTVDPYSTPGFTRFYARRRIGGCVLLNDALRVLKFADT